MYVQKTRVYKVENKKPNKNANPNYYLIVTENYPDMLFTKTDLKRATNRADSNKEDIPRYKIAKNIDRNVCWCIAASGIIGGFVTGLFLGTF